MNTYRDFDNYLKEYPTEDGYFGNYGGNYLDDPELIKAFKEYAEGYNTIAQSAQFIAELRRIRKEFQGRPTPLYHCQKLSNLFGKTQIYLKREDLNHTGAHKLNHCMGEGLLAKYMGKKKLIAETGAGQHGVALATAAAYFGLECDIYMGEVDIVKQAPNVARMKLLGARVVPVSAGLKTLKEAVDAAFEAYSREYKDAIYCIGTAAGPHPFPLMVRDFQQVIGDEARSQFIEMTGHLPDKVIVCWRRNRDAAETGSIVRTHLSGRERAVWSVAILAGVAVLWGILLAVGGNRPFCDAFTNVLSIAAMVLTVKRCIEQWVMWLVVDAIEMFMWWHTGADSMAILAMWALFFVDGCYCFGLWLRK